MRLRNAFLAAKDGNEVEKIIGFVLTRDEMMKIGRRVQIAEMLMGGEMTIGEIKSELKVGTSTVQAVSRALEENKGALELILDRGVKVRKEFEKRAYRKIGGAKLLHKKKVWTGYRRKDVER